MARKKQAHSVLEGRDYYRRRYEESCKKPRSANIFFEGTEKAISRIERLWAEYSIKIVQSDPRQLLEKADVNRFTNFLGWYCYKYTAKKVSSVVTYWHTLSQLYIQCHNGTRIDALVLRQVETYIYGELAEEYDIEDTETHKPLLDALDCLQVLRCLWTTDSNTFPHELFGLKLAAYTGSRPAALLAIEYGDIRLFVQRDRENPHKSAHMMAVKLRNRLAQLDFNGRGQLHLVISKQDLPLGSVAVQIRGIDVVWVMPQDRID